MLRSSIKIIQRLAQAVDPTQRFQPAEHRAKMYSELSRSVKLSQFDETWQTLLFDEQDPELRAFLVDLHEENKDHTTSPRVMSASLNRRREKQSLSACMLEAASLTTAALRRFAITKSAVTRLGAVGDAIGIHVGVQFLNPDQISVGNRFLVKSGTTINGRSETSPYGIQFGDDIYIKENCYIDSYGATITTGRCVAIGQQCIFDGGGNIDIGNYVMFGAHCYLISSTHRTDNPKIPFIFQGDKHTTGVKIGSNVFIGGGSIILDGAHIEDDCVIGAGSIVTRYIPAGSIYVDRSPRLLKNALRRRDL